VRERLSSANGEQRMQAATLAAIEGLIGSVDGLPEDLSSAKNRHLQTGYGRKHRR
jgi:hypothetical protein